MIPCNSTVEVTIYGMNAAAARLPMQTDANLVLYNAVIAPPRNSGTGGKLGTCLAVQDYSNVVIYLSATPLWYSSTSC